jgi:hypothetical protein
MMMKSTVVKNEIWLTFLLSTVFIFTLIACGGGGGSSDSQDTPFSIIGQWEITDMEGVPDGVTYSSNLNFFGDATYDVDFYSAGYYDISDSGAYSLNGTSLSVDGDLSYYIDSPTQITIISDQQFSLIDSDGDKWILTKVADFNDGEDEGDDDSNNDTNTSNLAIMHGVASADEWYRPSGQDPSEAIDGDEVSKWSANGFGTSDSPHWLIIDLKSSYTINEIVLKSDDMPQYGSTYHVVYNLYISENGADWTLIANGTMYDDPDRYMDTITYSGEVRYVKYEVVGGSHWAHLNEIEIY